jgi:hypothetical protein
MNVVATYLEEHREALGLHDLGLPRDPAFILITPRFAQSRHVVVLVLAPGSTRPVLAAKIPRRAGDAAELSREATKLRQAADATGGDGSVPALVAFDPDRPYPILLQRALTGEPLSPAAVTHDRPGAVSLVAGWCDRVASRTARPAQSADHLDRLALEPLRLLAGPAGRDAGLADLARRTLPLVDALLAAGLPAVFEHGDLGHPNLLVEKGKLGVLDFERAEPAGLPGHDLAFFCAYAATADAGRRTPAHAVVEAFDGSSPWAREAFAKHLRGMGIDSVHDTALLTLACARVVAQAVGAGAGPVAGGRDAGARHLALWRHLLRAEAGGATAALLPQAVLA